MTEGRGQPFDYDFIVIGSGFGGSVSALRLAEKGYRVCVLEAGRRYRDEDFPKTNMNLFKSVWMPALRLFGIFRFSLIDDAMILSGAGVGGGSLNYCNTLLQPPDPFYQDPQWSGMKDWKATLAPHYETARRMLGVTRVPAMTPADEVLKGVAEEMGCADSFRLQDVGVYFGEPDKTVPDPYFDGEGPERTGCKLCGGCIVGCRYNAKNTLVKNYLYLAEKRGVEILPETSADLIREHDGGYAVDTFRTTSWFKGGRRSFTAAKVVLSAGVMGTLPLLFRCRDQGTLGALSPQLGRRVRTNSEAINGFTAWDDAIDFTKGSSITSSIYVDEVTHIEPVRFSDGSNLISFIATPLADGSPRTRPLRWLLNAFLHPLVYLRCLWPAGFARRSVIFLVMQTLDNSIRLFEKRRWWWPFKRTLASKREDGRARIPALIPQAQAAAKIAAERVNGIPRNNITEVLFNMGTTAHILGGCAIGPDPEHGVIDGQNRVYGHEGLYVVDGSMMPANLGVNPSLTITAMAEQAMSHVPVKEGADA